MRARNKNESLKKYHESIKAENTRVKNHLKGKLVHVSTRHVYPAVGEPIRDIEFSRKYGTYRNPLKRPFCCLK